MNEHGEEVDFSRIISEDELAKYNKKLSDFLASTDAVTQSSETSWLASKFVIDAVEDYPQDPLGGIAIIADELLSTSGNIGIREMAQIIPDGSRCAEEINSRHKKFKILEHIGLIHPSTAIDLISFLAGSSLDKIRELACVHSGPLNISVPDILNEKVNRLEEHDNETTGPWIINRQVAFALDKFLANNQGVRNAVAATIKIEADGFRTNSRAQQKKQIHVARGQ